MYFVEPFDLFHFSFVAKNEKGTIASGQCEKNNKNNLNINLAPDLSSQVKWLDIEGSLIDDQSWAVAGHILIFEQFELKSEDVVPSSLSLMKDPNEFYQPFTIIQSSSQLFVEQDNRRVLIVCKTSGQIINFCNTLTNVETNYSRAATDNDRGGADLLMGFVLPKFVVDTYGKIFGDKLFSYLHHWKTVGLTPGALDSVVVSSRFRYLICDWNIFLN